jgi:hypothetical protein
MPSTDLRSGDIFFCRGAEGLIGFLLRHGAYVPTQVDTAMALADSAFSSDIFFWQRSGKA